MPRTTLNIDSDVLQAARAMAHAEGRSLGEMVSKLVRRGLRPRQRSGSARSFPTFPVPPDAAPITPETVARALDEDS
jgi:hypothetical protein